MPSSSVIAYESAPPIAIAPPKIAPPMNPIPPRTVWTTTWIELKTLYGVNSTVRLRNANRIPPSPAIPAASPKA